MTRTFPAPRHGAALAMAALLLAGCATRPAPVARLGLKLAPAALGETISVQQHLEAERGGKVNDLDVVLQVDPASIDMVGVAFGQRVLTLSYDGKELTSSRHMMLPKELRAEDVLEDMQVTLWPADAVRAALPAGWAIEENGLRRTLSQDGQPVMVIDYSSPVRWQGRVVLQNLRYQYKLAIESAPLEGQ